MGKMYVIREAYFFYTDENFVPQGWTRVVERLSDEQKAKARVRELSREQFGMVADMLTDWTFNEPRKEEAVLAFAAKHFPRELDKAKQGRTHAYEVLRALELRHDMPDVLKDELLAAIDLKFYGVFAFDAEPVFYKPELVDSFFGKNKPYFSMNEEGFPAMFDSKQDALDMACESLFYATWLNPPGLSGSYEQLSALPEALAALVSDGVGGVKMFEKLANGIAIEKPDDQTVFRNGLLALAPLLKVPPFVIREIDFEEARTLKAEYAEEDEEGWGEDELVLLPRRSDRV